MPTTSSQNYYHFPPESDDDDDDDTGDDSFASPPMPDEPPPPPPTDLGVNQWVERTMVKGSDDGSSQHYVHYPETRYTGGEVNQPYAIALYDYVSDVEGGLNIQAGDLVYLTKRIDESWLYGMCGGVEGMFPTGYVNVVVALPEEEEEKGHGEEQGHGQVPLAESYHPVSSSENPVSSRDSSSDCKQHLATALYQFQAETENDLSSEVKDSASLVRGNERTQA